MSWKFEKRPLLLGTTEQAFYMSSIDFLFLKNILFSIVNLFYLLKFLNILKLITFIEFMYTLKD